MSSVREPHVKRWDQMTAEERAAASARIAADECAAAGVTLLASDEQHRAVAAALAVAPTAA